jgi:thiol-disulfide isomerase/thioredoxin
MTARVPWIAALLASLSVAAAAASAALAQAPATAPTSPPPTLVPGDVVMPFDAVGLDGVTRHIDFPKGSRTVVLFFLSSCPVCHKMMPVWSEYYQRKPSTVNVVAIMLDTPPPGFLAAMPITFPVMRSPGANRAFKVNHVPMTIRVGPGGKVEEVGEGVLDPIRMGQIFRP